MDTNIYSVLCPQKIVTSKLNIPISYKEVLIRKVYSIGDFQQHSTNLLATMSDWRIWEYTNKFNPLLDKILKFITYYYPPDLTTRYDMVSAWSAIYEKHNKAIPHNHSPAYLSFVYYLQSDVRTPLEFTDCNFKVDSIEDSLVIFPSYLNHSVPDHKSNLDRIIIAGNIEAHYEDCDCNKLAYNCVNN